MDEKQGEETETLGKRMRTEQAKAEKRIRSLQAGGSGKTEKKQKEVEIELFFVVNFKKRRFIQIRVESNERLP